MGTVILEHLHPIEKLNKENLSAKSLERGLLKPQDEGKKCGVRGARSRADVDRFTNIAHCSVCGGIDRTYDSCVPQRKPKAMSAPAASDDSISD